MNVILALDVSTSCTGFAFGAPSAVPVSGTVKWDRMSDEPDSLLWRAELWLNRMITTSGATIVAIEAPIKSSKIGNTNAISQAELLSLQGVLRSVAFGKTKRTAKIIQCATARKTFTGRGTFPGGEAKAAVQAEVLRRGWLDAGELQPDRCDALCLWAHMAAQQLPELAFHKSKKAA